MGVVHPFQNRRETMSGLIANFPTDGIVTINRVILKPEYTVDDRQTTPSGRDISSTCSIRTPRWFRRRAAKPSTTS